MLSILLVISSCAKTNTVSAGSDQATQGDDLNLRKDDSQIAPVVDRDEESPQSASKSNVSGDTSSTSTVISMASHSAIITSTYTTTRQDTQTDTPPPPNPTPKLPGAFGFTGVARTSSDTGVILSWAASAGAKSYIVLRGTSLVALSQVASNLTDTTYTDQGPLTRGMTYFYSISAVNDDGATQINSAQSIDIPSASQGVAPGHFTIISARPEVGRVTLTWIPPSGADSYNIFRGPSANSLTSIASNITNTSYVDSTVSNGTTYYYSVQALNAYDHTSSDNTPSAAVPNPSITTPPGAFAMIAPTYATNGVTITWNGAENATSYSLLRGTSAGSMASIISNLTSTSYIDATSLPSTTYYYSVTASNANGSTTADAPVSITTPSTNAPGPFTITSTVQGTKKVILTWSASNSAISYTVKRGTSAGSYTTTLSSGNFLTYTDTSCMIGTTYYYMVTATNAQSVTTNASNPSVAGPLWGTQQLDAGASDRKGTAIAIDKTNSNIYVSSSNGDVNKYDKYATPGWSTVLSAPRVTALAVDSSSNVFAAGTTITPVGDGLTSLVGTSDIFVTKFDGSGNKSWTVESGVQWQTAGVYGMATNNNGDLFVIANTGDGVGKIYENDDFAAAPANNMNYVDYALFRFNKSATGSAYTNPTYKQNATPRTSQLFTYAYGIASDLPGNTYITGWTTRSNLNGSGAAAGVGVGRKDAFVVKSDSLGNSLFTRQYGINGFESKGTAIAYDNVNYYVYMTGTTGGGLDGNAVTGTMDGFIMKFDTGLNKQWSVQFGISGAYVRTTGITLDSAGKVYVSGYTNGTFPGNTKSGAVDFFVAKYDPATTPATLQWVKQFGVTNTTMKATGIAGVTSSGIDSVYAVGETGGGMDGNPLLSKIGLFLIKMDTAGQKK